MSIERLHSIHRSPVSLFDSAWGDMGSSSRDDFEATLRAMEWRMREMDRQFEQMFNQFLRLTPTSETRSSLRTRGDRDRLGVSSFGSGFNFPDECEALEQGATSGGVVPAASGSVPAVAPRGPRRPFFSQKSWDWGFPDTEHPADPVVVESDGKRMFRLRYDVRQFKPEDITVKTLDNKLEVSAKHEEGDENNRVYREYHRMCLLPKGLEPETLESNFTPEGILTIEAPMPAIEAPQAKIQSLPDKPVPIAIQHQKSVPAVDE